MKQSSKRGFFQTLENNFAAAAMAEANLDSAREFLQRSEPVAEIQASGSLATKVKNVADAFQNHYAAAAMAEGSAEMAREFLPDKPAGSASTAAAKVKRFFKAFEDTFAAAAMAEGGQEMARDYLNIKESRSSKTSLHDFLQTVGLKDAQVQYRIAFI